MFSAAERKQREGAVSAIFDLMRKYGLALDDLIQIGGESDPKRAEKVRRVSKCWDLMARLSVKFADLEAAPRPLPDKWARRRRGERVVSQVTENTDVSDFDSAPTKFNEINNLGNSAPVGDPNPGSVQ
jgi:hypothetical protein